MTGPRIPGVSLEYRPKGRNRPYLVIIDTKIAGNPWFKSASYVTEDEGERAYAEAAGVVTRARQDAEQQAALLEALNVPALPTAPKGVVLFEPMAADWLEQAVKPPRRAASTYLGYQRLLRLYLLPIMRTWPVNDDVMSTKRLTALLKTDLYAQQVTLTNRIACLRCLGAFFAWARTQLPPKTLQINPLAGLRTDLLRQDDELTIALHQEPNPMTRVQVEAFLRWIAEHYPEVHEFFIWLVDAGSRVGEVSALKWAHLELEHGKAHIIDNFSWAQRTYERREEKLGHRTGGQGERVATLPPPPRFSRQGRRGDGEKDTKTHRSNQYIDLSDRLIDVLPRLRSRNLEAWMKRGAYGRKPEHVFLNSQLTKRRPDRIVRRSFREGCDALQLRGQTGETFTVHCLRDTFATLAILEGKLDLGWVAMMLGHASVDTLKKHYFKWVRLVEANPLAGVKR